MPVEGPDDLIAMTGTISSLMENPNEISPDAQFDMLNLVENSFLMLDKVDDPDVLASSLTGVLNMAGLVSEVSANTANVNDPDNPDIDGVKMMSKDSPEELMKKVFFLFVLLQSPSSTIFLIEILVLFQF